MASRTLKRSNGEEEIVATQSLDLAKPFDAKYLRNVVSSGRMRDQRPWKWYCVDERTECLTADKGWVLHSDLEPGDLAYALNHETGLASWEPVGSVHRFDVVDEPMLSMEMRHHSSLSTGNHRWPVLRIPYKDGDRAPRMRTWTTSEELMSEDQIITAAPSADRPVEAKYSDDLVEIMAWFWTEGSIRKDRRSPSITISQSRKVNPDKCARIRGCLQRLFDPGQWREYVHEGRGETTFTVKVEATPTILQHAPNKVVRPEFILALTRSQLELFLTVSMMADGYPALGTITQNCPERLDAYELACILAGRTPHRTTPIPDECWTLNDLPRTTATPRKQHRSIKNYTGIVWCPVTPSQSWLARRDGCVFFTGNTSIGEIHYAISRGAKVAGYANITARKLEKDGTPGDIITTGPEAEIAASLSSPYGGKRALIDRFFTLMKIPGDCYLIKCMDGPDHVGYDFIGASEISRNDTSGGSLGQDTDAVFRPGSKIQRITLPAAGSTTGEELSIEIAAENFLGRIWRPSNQYVDMADSPMRALDVECEQLHLLTLGIKAKLLNRLALNGIFFIPQGMNDIKTAAPDGKANPTVHENKVMDQLIKAATWAVQNPESAEAAVPIFMSGDLAMGEAIRHIVFDREIYKVDMDLRHELITRLLMGLDVQPQHVKGLGDANHWCQGQDTEIMCLTRGWTKQEDLRVGDMVLTLDHDLGTSAWQPVKDIYRAEVVDEPMLSMESQSHSSLSTKAHRWPIIKVGRRVAGTGRRWTTAEKGFTSTDRVPVAARLVSDLDERKWTDDFVRLIAAFTSDGTVLTSRYDTKYIRIAKFDPDEIVELRRICTSVFGGTDGWNEAFHPTPTVDGTAFIFNRAPSDLLFSVTGEMKAVKLSFVDQLTSAQLDLFLDSMIEIGDGIRVGNSIQLFQVEPSRLDAFEYAAILAGRKVTRGVRNQQTGFGERPLSWLQISTSRKSFSPVDCIQEWVPYTGIVWCPVTENTTWLARRNGKVFYTGNSAWAVSDDERRINIQPDMETLCWALTRLVLYREMKVLQETNSKITDARIAKTCLWYDLTEANVKTNLSEDARQAQDRILIGPAAARRLTGLSESDAPTDLEAIRMIGMKQGDAYLATYGMPEAAKFDWTKISSHSGGPDPASPADNPTQVGPGVGSPGAPGKSESDTPRKLRPA